jgi:hypothetical protein
MCTPFDRLLGAMLETPPQEFGEGQTFLVGATKDANPEASPRTGRVDRRTLTELSRSGRFLPDEPWTRESSIWRVAQSIHRSEALLLWRSQCLPRGISVGLSCAPRPVRGHVTTPLAKRLNGITYTTLDCTSGSTDSSDDVEEASVCRWLRGDRAAAPDSPEALRAG